MSFNSAKTIDPELLECIMDGFAASEDLYRLAIEELAQGRSWPADEESPAAIAFRVAMNAIKYGLPCPIWAAEDVARRWEQFENFQHATLDGAFGIAKHKHSAAKRDRLLCAAIYTAVRELQAAGVPLTGNARTGKGALAQVGDRYHMSGKKVEMLMTMWRKTCRDAGHDPDEKPKYGDAVSIVDSAFYRALTGFE